MHRERHTNICMHRVTDIHTYVYAKKERQYFGKERKKKTNSISKKCHKSIKRKTHTGYKQKPRETHQLFKENKATTGPLT